jgi:hypothetical protein
MKTPKNWFLAACLLTTLLMSSCVYRANYHSNDWRYGYNNARRYDYAPPRRPTVQVTVRAPRLAMRPPRVYVYRDRHDRRSSSSNRRRR